MSHLNKLLLSACPRYNRVESAISRLGTPELFRGPLCGAKVSLMGDLCNNTVQ
jgi:hypothetical protein